MSVDKIHKKKKNRTAFIALKPIGYLNWPKLVLEKKKKKIPLLSRLDKSRSH